MKAHYLAKLDLDAALDPQAKLWQDVGATSLKLDGTPLGLQPTGAIRAAWADKQIGLVDNVGVKAVHDGQNLAFHLVWRDATENRNTVDNTSFPDAAAVFLPAAAGAPVITMGAPNLPVNAWYWRADDLRGHHVVAEGIGTTDTIDYKTVRARGFWSQDHWHVVIARALRVDSPRVAQLDASISSGFSVAIWDGSNGERAGIKSFSGDWQALKLGAAPAART
ncbi:MAG: ethylbenzene dehydrogenase-related protein [Pseudomonadales bacterium]|jgi:DMSO reductase family type II enzyme heme b subunit|nr:ethylbenzene dehydrogenase-related protein [Pseudomonadales bacterium]MDP6473265.1 ethylbenzene dehydrogenase-related protein [Pseudomonadales bacterium]MDP6829190.1 ethylbenzene dehydrogenase-related protein [Pseudomonadales bacterium]|tara:strand:+ start:437 stop:1102 length:666 start_codon:yes stop_codon:yes gene_type:complete